MYKKKEWFSLALAGFSAFCVYTCMFAFRKPFTAANYNNQLFLGFDYKVWLVVAQTIGYALSKFYGISFIASLGRVSHTKKIIFFISWAWIALLFFAVTPAPYNIIFLLLNGFPLGIIYGLVFTYLEGRRSTEMLGAILATSFIFASGFAQSAGKFVAEAWAVNQWWMPFVTGSLFIIPTILFAWLLGKTPSPTATDIALRTQRLPMNALERKKFVAHFLPGLTMLVVVYVLLTVMREYRSNFASNIWQELGINNAAVFTQTEIPASFVTLALTGLLIFVKSNIRALLINHVIIVAGFLLCIVFTLLYTNGFISAFWWMTIVGIGLYMGYVPFNCMLFDRLIASFKYVSNAGFIIYVADSFGYLGSIAVIITKNFLRLTISWGDFFVNLILIISVAGIVLTCLSAFYFKRKHQRKITAVPVQVC